jgi:polyhydroxybutyrate depolymerase
MLHGAGGSAGLAAMETGWSRLADTGGFAVFYPEGVATNPGRPSKFFTNPQEWHDGSGRGRHDDVAFLDAVIDNLPATIDRGRVFLTGFSNGAGMAFRYAAERADRIRALAPVAGHCWIDPKPVRPIPTFYMVGDSDPLVPLDGGMVHTFWRKDEWRPSVAETLRRWGEAIGQPPDSSHFQVKVIPNHGHHWPGGAALLGERLGGLSATGVDATAEIWEFFKSH